ncbi:GNAT family N-acetyltransferase [Acidaminobacter sp. JC074]|uniref:GNAT family N-acetyltransferase n=1 Tax=Acidaminobacter sp. JC074 TaxID=2530199 RepID=UPI001F0E5412|nr:GNAT family N-acetyltransferase [Acidaminobacter sp. JC074]MCH4887989.1 GNAT family N-acetyltransferase [Acidaminobacter sp. JC074]
MSGLKINIHEMKKRDHKYVVIVAMKDDELIMVRHKDRQTYEIPGGHVEEGETLFEAAKRELYEETGAIEYEIWPIGDYSVNDSYGRLFGADIKRIGPLPDSEIVEVTTLNDKMTWTYEKIQPFLKSFADRYLKIRMLEKEDAESFKNLLLSLDHETKNMMYEPGERQVTRDSLRERIEPGSFVIEDNGLKGFISLSRGKCNRIKHSGYIVMGILKSHSHLKYGTLLFNKALSYARSIGLHRLELTVMVHNEAGLSLYKKMGFEIEGVKKHSMFVDGKYVDEYYMAKLLEA